MSVVIILSDSHGMQEEVAVIKERHQNEVDRFIHCGDSELHFQSKILADFVKVRGNCDKDPQYPMEQCITIHHVPFYITHGHLYQVKMQLTNLSYRADEVGAQIVCFGHSHVATVEKVLDKLFINPGSIRQPRGGIVGKKPTYVRVTWDDKTEFQVEFLSLGGRIEKTVNVQLPC